MDLIKGVVNKHFQMGDSKYGWGTYTYTNGTEYVGEWKDDKPFRNGILTFTDGRKYDGELKNNKFNGQGTLTYTTGDRYTGEWRDGNKNGRGIYTFADGRMYVGEFHNNKIHGHGSYTFSDRSKYVGGWKEGVKKPYQPSLKAKPVKAKECRMPIPDKQSIDMYLGQSIGIDRKHKDYYPLRMAVYVLGGNFSARLMQTVRDEAGLTYGIGSSVSGTNFGSDGYWSTWATFAPALLEKGREMTQNQINKWYNKGITENELNAKKTTITGTYQVGLDSTGGLARRILSNAEQGEKIEHLDKYPEIIKNISLDKVNKTIKKHIKPKELTFVAAGTFVD